MLNLKYTSPPQQKSISAADLDQEQYLIRLKQQMCSVRQYMESQMYLQDCLTQKQIGLQQTNQTLSQQVDVLRTQNYRLQVSIEQLTRYCKRYDMKLHLLNRKVEHLSTSLTEKEAIIKYLEQKSCKPNEDFRKKIQASSKENLSINFDFNEHAKSASNRNCSFAQIRTSSNLKFSDYSDSSLQDTSQSGLNSSLRFDQRARPKRVKTEQIKQESGAQNMNCSTQRLKKFFHSKVWQKNDSKNASQESESFWKYSKGGLAPYQHQRDSHMGKSMTWQGKQR